MQPIIDFELIIESRTRAVTCKRMLSYQLPDGSLTEPKFHRTLLLPGADAFRTLPDGSGCAPDDPMGLPILTPDAEPLCAIVWSGTVFESRMTSFRQMNDAALEDIGNRTAAAAAAEQDLAAREQAVQVRRAELREAIADTDKAEADNAVAAAKVASLGGELQRRLDGFKQMEAALLGKEQALQAHKESLDARAAALEQLERSLNRAERELRGEGA
jgi:hypothetical protein